MGGGVIFMPPVRSVWRIAMDYTRMHENGLSTDGRTQAVVDRIRREQGVPAGVELSGDSPRPTMNSVGA